MSPGPTSGEAEDVFLVGRAHMYDIHTCPDTQFTDAQSIQTNTENPQEICPSSPFLFKTLPSSLKALSPLANHSTGNFHAPSVRAQFDQLFLFPKLEKLMPVPTECQKKLLHLTTFIFVKTINAALQVSCINDTLGQTCFLLLKCKQPVSKAFPYF